MILIPADFFSLFLYPGDSLLQIRRILVTGQNRDDSFAIHLFGKFGHHFISAVDIVGPEVGEPLALGHIGIKANDRDTLSNRRIDGVGKLVSVGRAHGDTVRSSVHECFDRFDCFCGSSSFGVRQSILMVTPSFSPKAFASSSAPVFAA